MKTLMRCTVAAAAFGVAGLVVVPLAFGYFPNSKDMATVATLFGVPTAVVAFIVWGLWLKTPGATGRRQVAWAACVGATIALLAHAVSAATLEFLDGPTTAEQWSRVPADAARTAWFSLRIAWATIPAGALAGFLLMFYGTRQSQATVVA